MTTRIWLAGLGLSLLLAGGAVGAGPSTDTLYPATVTFSDRFGDAITSDYANSGNHSYTNTPAKRFEVGFHTVTNDLVMRTLSNSIGRYLAFSFAPIAPPSAPTGTLQQNDMFMNIHTILNMPTGTAKNTVANFSSDVGMFRYTPTWVDPTYATLVFVSRSGNVWTVTADPNPVPGAPGDVAGLVKTKGNTETLVGLYHMPFQITVTCPTCP